LVECGVIFGTHTQYPNKEGGVVKSLVHCAMCVFLAILFLVPLTESALAQDATKVDSEHYKLEFENDQVRVLRITYGPHEKGVMHEHPAGLAVFLTGGKGKFTFPDGKTEEIEWKAGQTLWLPAVKHLPENLTDKPFELIQVEFKVKEAKAEEK
jgi:quercetin dioxygenase-like cupin family protein